MKLTIVFALLAGMACGQYVPTPNPGDPLKISSGGGGGGASPAGSNGDVQIKNGTSLGAANLNYNSGTGKLAVSGNKGVTFTQATSSDVTYVNELVPFQGTGTVGAFRSGMGSALFNGTWDHIWRLGYNVNMGGTAAAPASEHTYYYTIEANYNDGARNLIEAYFETSDPVLGITQRPWTVNVNRGTGVIQHQFSFGANDGNVIFQQTPAGLETFAVRPGYLRIGGNDAARFYVDANGDPYYGINIKHVSSALQSITTGAAMAARFSTGSGFTLNGSSSLSTGVTAPVVFQVDLGGVTRVTGNQVITTNANNTYNLSLESASTNTSGAGILFTSNIGVSSKTGLFSLDSAGNMVFRANNASQYFDYNGTVNFRANAGGGATGLSIDNSGNSTHGGNLIFGTDAAYDIGASGANRPRDLFMSRTLTAGTSVIVPLISSSGVVAITPATNNDITLNPNSLAAVGINSARVAMGSGVILQWSNGAGAYTSSKDSGISRNSAGIVEINSGTAGTFRDLKLRNRIMTVGSSIASASTIAPTDSLHHVTGTTTIDTITAPSGFAVSGAGGCITLIPDGLWATSTSGNIKTATTAVVDKPLNLCYDNATSKWYPSY